EPALEVTVLKLVGAGARRYRSAGAASAGRAATRTASAGDTSARDTACSSSSRGATAAGCAPPRAPAADTAPATDLRDTRQLVRTGVRVVARGADDLVPARDAGGQEQQRRRAPHHLK